MVKDFTVGGRSLSPVARVRVEEHSRIGRRVNDSSDNVLEAWCLLRRLDRHGPRSPRHEDIGGNDRLAKNLSMRDTSTFVRDRLSGQQYLSWELSWVSCACTHNFCLAPLEWPSTDHRGGRTGVRGPFGRELASCKRSIREESIPEDSLKVWMKSPRRRHDPMPRHALLEISSLSDFAFLMDDQDGRAGACPPA